MTSLVDEAYDGLRSAGANRSSRSRLVTVAALSLIASQLVFRSWASYGGWFYGDDLTFLADVARGEVDRSWIFQRYGFQFMPVGLTLAAIVGEAGAFAWPVAATELVVFQAVASLGCWWMLRTLFGNRPMILAPLTVYLFSSISIPALMWWAAGLNMITVQPAIFAAITLHILYLRSGRKRFAILATLAFGFGLLCYVKALLIPLVLAMIALSYFSQGGLFTRFVDVLKRFWFGWALYGTIGAVYVWLYATGVRTELVTTAGVDYPALINNMVFANLGTGLLGGPWNWSSLGPSLGPRLMSDPSQLAVTLSTVAVVLGFLYAALRLRGALKPLLFLLPYVALTVVMIGQGRAASFGVGVSMEIRYWTDFVPYVALAIGLMSMPLLGSTDPLTRREPPLVNLTIPRPVGPGLVALFVASALYSSITYIEPWHDNYDTRRFIAQAQAEFERDKGSVEIADETAPDAVVSAFSYPYNLPSHFLAPLGKEFSTPDVGTDLKAFDELGRLSPGHVGEGLSVPSKNLGDCVVGTKTGNGADIRLGARTLNFPFWLAVTYRADSDGSVTLVAGENTREATVREGKHTLFVRTEGRYDTMSLSASPGSTLCIEAIQIGPRIEAGR